MRKILPIAAAIVLGLVVLVDFFIPNPELDAVGAVLAEGASILAAFALILGLLNILATHARRLGTREPHRAASALLIVAMLGTFAASVALPGPEVVRWIFRYAYVPLQATMTALLAFFVVTAVFRSFRIRNLAAALLMITCLFILVMQLPLVSALAPRLADIRDWLLRVPVTAGIRGILLGAALGTVATSLRVLLAVDRPYVGE